MRTSALGNFATGTLDLANDVDDATVDDFSLDTAGDISVNGVSIDPATDAADGLGNGSAKSIVDAINLKTDTHGVTAKVGDNEVTVTAAQIANASIAFTDAGTDDTLTYTMSINGTQILQHGETFTRLDANGLAQAINGAKDSTGISAAVQSSGGITLSAGDGRNIEISEVLGGSTGGTDTFVGYFGNAALDSTGATTTVDVYKADITLTSEQAISVTVAGGSDALFVTPAPGGSVSFNTSTIDSANVLTAGAADTAISKVDQALEEVGTLRGTFGAIQSRFDSTIANLEAAAENQTAARSRIRDADFAQETRR